jgi:hypothetical protein
MTTKIRRAHARTGLVLDFGMVLRGCRKVLARISAQPTVQNGVQNIVFSLTSVTALRRARGRRYRK